MQAVAWLLVCLVTALVLHRRPLVLVLLALTLWCPVPGIAAHLVTGASTGLLAAHPAAFLVLAAFAVRLVIEPRSMLSRRGPPRRMVHPARHGLRDVGALRGAPTTRPRHLGRSSRPGRRPGGPVLPARQRAARAGIRPRGRAVVVPRHGCVADRDGLRPVCSRVDDPLRERVRGPVLVHRLLQPVDGHPGPPARPVALPRDRDVPRCRRPPLVARGGPARAVHGGLLVTQSRVGVAPGGPGHPVRRAEPPPQTERATRRPRGGRRRRRLRGEHRCAARSRHASATTPGRPRPGPTRCSTSSTTSASSCGPVGGSTRATRSPRPPGSARASRAPSSCTPSTSGWSWPWSTSG